MAALLDKVRAGVGRFVAGSRPADVGGNPGAIYPGPRGPEEPWPPEKELPRLEQYARGFRLFQGAHKSLFEAQRDELRHGPYVVVNVCAAVTKALTDFLVLEPPKVTLVGEQREAGPEDAASGPPYSPTTDLAKILRATKWPTFLQRSVNSWSYNGDKVLKVVWDDLKKCPRLVNIPPGRYFPLFSDEDDSVVKAVGLCWITALEGKPTEERGLLREELHVPGAYEVRIYRIKRSHEGPTSLVPRFRRELLEVQEPVATGLDVIPIVHIANNAIQELTPWGQSDYFHIEDLQSTLNGIASDNRHIIKKWADPKIAMDESYFDEDNNVNALDLTAIKLVQDEPPPQYVSVPLENYTHADNEAKETIRRMLMVMGVSPPTVGIADDAPLPQSGRALLVGEGLTRRTGSRKRAPLDDGLREALAIACQFWAVKGGGPGALQADDLLIDWSEGFPKAERERIEEVVLDKSADTLSDFDLLKMRFPEWTAEEIEAAVERKRKDREVAAELQVRTAMASRPTPTSVSNPDRPAADKFESGTSAETRQQAEARVRSGAKKPE